MDQQGQQNEGSCNLQAVLQRTPHRAGHGQLKCRGVDHCQLNKEFVSNLDTTFMDRLCQELVTLWSFCLRQPVEPLGMQACEPNHPICSAGELTVCKSIRGTGTLCDIQRIRKGHRRPLAAIHGPFQQKLCASQRIALGIHLLDHDLSGL